MGFFKKKKESKEPAQDIPKLPPLPEVPSDRGPANIRDLENIQEQKPTILPNFPNSSLGEKINQDTIKQAINKEEPKAQIQQSALQPPLSQPPQFPAQPPIQKIEQPPKQTSQEIQEPETAGNKISEVHSIEMSNWENERNQIKPQIKNSEPLFIRLDKFEHAVSTFNEIKLRLSEIDSLLKNIKSIKLKEEQELNEWEKEMETIKSRLDQIDNEIFSKV